MSDDPRLCRPPNPVFHTRLLYGLAFHLLRHLAIPRSASPNVPAHWPCDAPVPKVAMLFSRRLSAPTLPSPQANRLARRVGWGGSWPGRGSHSDAPRADLAGFTNRPGLEANGGPACPPG